MAWFRLVLQVLVVPVLIWIGMIHVRVTAIEANRFTSGDAQELYRVIAEMQVSDAEVVVDATWLRTELQEIKAEIADLRREVSRQ